MFTHIIGDIHGKFAQANKVCSRLGDSAKILCVGDIGIGFGIPNTLNKNIYGQRGNHDYPEEIRKWPNYIGDYGYLEDQGIFFVGGADSIDKQYRTPGLDWWPDEQLSLEDMELCLQQYEKNKPNIVISHEAPYFLFNNLLLASGGKINYVGNATAFLLDSMLAIHRPRRWYFGHWHVSWNDVINETHFRCLNELEVCKLVDT